VATNGVTTDLTKISQDPRTGKELSTAFSPEDRLFRDFTEHNKAPSKLGRSRRR
jgi:hypothetical protein